ncbi:MAG: hypothetical protein ABL886_04725 [Rhodoglobus sp.]
MRKLGIVRSVALTATAAQIVGPSEQRAALLFSPPTSGGVTYTVSTEPGVALGAGLNLSSTTGPLLLTEERFGDAVKKPWFAIASTTLTIGFLETIVD